MLFTLLSALLWHYFLLVEKENFAVTACVQHNFAYALFMYLELDWVGHIERIWTPKAFFLRKLPEWDYAELVSVSCIVWLLLFEMALSILYESILVIFDCLACIICPSFVALILSKVFILVYLIVTVLSRCNWVNNLDCDEAILYFGVRNTLRKTIFLLRKRLKLVIVFIETADKTIDEFRSVNLSLLFHVEVLVKEEFGLLCGIHGLSQLIGFFLVEHARHKCFVFVVQLFKQILSPFWITLH